MNALLVPLDRLRQRTLSVAKPIGSAATPLADQLGRPLTDLRLSVTDRCNFHCTYCMPRSNLGPVAAPTLKGNLLDFDGLMRVAAAFVDLGVRKVRLTGGEPLVRRDLPQLVEQLRRLRIDDLCLTTNGSLLAGQASALAGAGLGRVTVSLDALDEPTFQRMSDTRTSVTRVLAGIEAARRSSLGPIKINMVVQRNVNEHCIVPMARWARSEGLELRFIEYMDVGCSNGWKPSEVVTAAEIRERIHQVWPLAPTDRNEPFETAERFRYTDGAGNIGFIASISRPFCGTCTRARVSSRGDLHTCLFSPATLSLGPLLRDGSDLRSAIANVWHLRHDRFSELRTSTQGTRSRPEMSAIGG